MNTNELLERIKRYSSNIIGEDELKEKMKKQRLVVKFGADPTRPDLHLGHTVILRVLKLLQDNGHDIFFIVGDYTAMIGDPTGKSATRPPLTLEETRSSGETYLNQVAKILDPLKTNMVYNSQWLGKMEFRDLLMLTSKYTLSRLMEREDFKNRYNNFQPIAIHELLYPLIQGYDSVAIQADLEVGGTDQTFNLLVGRELQKDYGISAQAIITFPLLVGLDGKNKMSKSLDNYIGIDEAPEQMYEKSMKIPDEILEDYFRLTTDIDEAVYKKWLETDIFKAHKLYAAEIIKMYHGEEYVLQAEQRYENIARGKVPEGTPVFEIEVDGKKHLVEYLYAHNLIKSKSEGRRLINNRGISIREDKVLDPNYVVTMSDFDKEEMHVKIGKNRFYIFKINQDFKA